MSSTTYGSRHLTAAALLVSTGFLLSGPALAQRTDDNVTAQSDDAFGRSVGDESLGIYTPDQVRGFSPVDAGNVRVEGLYFDQQTDPNSRLADGSAIRVGIASQSYPFPSPTGIVDYGLRRVGDKQVISPVLTYGPFDGMGLEVDAQIPIQGERLGLAAGVEVYRNGFAWGGSNHQWAVALMPRWIPAEGIELRPFFSRSEYRDEEPQPLMLTEGGVLPDRIPREHYYGQTWAKGEGVTSTHGFLGSMERGDWTVRLGLFESVFAPKNGFADLYVGIDENNQAREVLIAFQDSRYASKSGELRVSRVFEGATRRHTLYFSVRGREQKRRYGGEDEVDLGMVEIGVGSPATKPQFQFGEQTYDEVRQSTGGVAYQLQWKDVGEMSIGLQKTSYEKNSDTPLGPLPESSANPLLKNATATYYASEKLAIYASYAQGLEESPVAPDNAVNRNAAAPAIDTRQYDAGVRYTLTRNLNLILGVFEVEKPNFDLDPQGVFRQLGDVRHRGIEMSLAGSPFENLTIIAGLRILDAQVSGEQVEAGIIGETPVGVFRTHTVASANYVVGATGFSVDLGLEAVSRQTATSLNTEQVPARHVIRVGGRYQFEAFGKPMTLRAQVSNLFDRYGWSAVGSGAYVYNAPRRYTMYLAADL